MMVFGRCLAATGAVLALALAARGDMLLVENGEARCAVVVGRNAPESERMAAEDLRNHLERAGGAEISLIEAPDADAEGRILLVVGARAARQMGIEVPDLQPEEYVVKTLDNAVLFAGHDIVLRGRMAARVRISNATLWAVVHYLDRHLGARWLWPGEGGTFVPKREVVTIPPMNVRARPDLERRVLRTHLTREPSEELLLLTDEERQQLAEENELWKMRHGLGERSAFGFGHAFQDWWERFHETHPHYFAHPPAGRQQPFPRETRVKLCVSEPAVVEQVVADWKAAGAPDNWNVCPNDGSGFCTCDGCRALDDPPMQDPDDIWRSRANLTGRYVDFWNRLIRQMRETNPNATISSYAYSAYRNPPENGTLEDGIVLGIVHTYTADAKEAWRQWTDAGARLFLRPNWWHMGGPAPHNPLRAAGGYFEFARQHSMVGFDFDSLQGHWSVQGPYYYLIARLSARPDLTVDDVIAEYASGFGPAAPAVAEYLEYWTDYADRCAYAVPAGGVVSQDPDGLYEQVCREHNLNPHPIRSSWAVMPHLYDDETLAPALDMLEQAEAQAGDDAKAAARVEFLRDGLRHLVLTRDVAALGYKGRDRTEAEEEEWLRLAARLQALRRRLTPSHAIWGETLNAYEARRGYPTATGRVHWTETDGM